VGRRSKIKHCIVDEDSVVPEDLQIGYDPLLDQQRFSVTKSGVVLVTKDMLRSLR
jgi:glucose-1-phosphate adenylyltransferase